ncbi:MAG: hypothetical protein QOG05_1311 [Streptosporangiaceae bacterium]|jgi:hypothetical protein|nr:hypothetical protein [Streptosporangiaceae bacterium]
MTIILFIAAVVSILGPVATGFAFLIRRVHSMGFAKAEKKFDAERQDLRSKLGEAQRKFEAERQNRISELREATRKLEAERENHKSQMARAERKFGIEHEGRLQSQMELRHANEFLDVLKLQLGQPDRRSRDT